MWTRIPLCLGAVVLLAWVSPARPRPELHVPRVHGQSSATGQNGPGPQQRPIAVLAVPPTEPPPRPAPAETPARPAETILPAEPSEPVDYSLDRYQALLTAITIFVLALFVGYEVINKVPTMLHTPLMSGSNAISGITVVGAIIVGGYALPAFSSFLGFLAIVLATINVVGGFLVTHRMLAMFKRK
jgi:NAD(P) transhydrogenase subunit alpha